MAHLGGSCSIIRWIRQLRWWFKWTFLLFRVRLPRLCDMPGESLTVVTTATLTCLLPMDVSRTVRSWARVPTYQQILFKQRLMILGNVFVFTLRTALPRRCSRPNILQPDNITALGKDTGYDNEESSCSAPTVVSTLLIKSKLDRLYQHMRVLFLLYCVPQ